MGIPSIKRLISVGCLAWMMFGPPVLAEDALIINVEDAAAPWSCADGTGYANDLVTAIYKAANVPIVLKVLPYARAKSDATNGHAVGCFSMANIPEVQKEFIFPKVPLFLEYISYYQNVANPLPVKKEELLPQGTVVGSVLGYEYSEKFYQLKNSKVIRVEETPSEKQNLKKLAMGRINTAILVHNETKIDDLIIKQAGASGKVELAFRALTIELHLGFAKAHPKAQWALEQYNKGMKIIKSNGTYEQITKKWIAKARAELQ